MHFATFVGTEIEARDACVELVEARSAWNGLVTGEVRFFFLFQIHQYKFLMRIQGDLDR
jgi:hypothetical protein